MKVQPAAVARRVKNGSRRKKKTIVIKGSLSYQRGGLQQNESTAFPKLLMQKNRLQKNQDALWYQ